MVHEGWRGASNHDLIDAGMQQCTSGTRLTRHTVASASKFLCFGNPHHHAGVGPIEDVVIMRKEACLGCMGDAQMGTTLSHCLVLSH